MTACLRNVRRGVFPGEFKVRPVDAEFLVAEVHFLGVFLQSENVELNRLLDGVLVEFQFQGRIEEWARKCRKVKTQVKLACIAARNVCNMEFRVGVVRAVVVEFRNPGGGTASAGETVARVVERGVALVEYVDLACVGTGLVAVIASKDDVVAAARGK